MTYLAAIAASVAIMFGMFRLSLWLTDRKMSAELASARPDASAMNAEGSPAYDSSSSIGGED